MIECRLQLMEKSRFANNNPSYKKHGHYMSCFYSIKGYGTSCWVVVANILVDHKKYLNQGMSLEEVAIRCVEYLNHRPKSKYGKRRLKKPLYGAFKPEPYLTKLVTKGDREYIQVLLVVENRKNPNFWGEGNKGEYSSCRRKKRK